MVILFTWHKQPSWNVLYSLRATRDRGLWTVYIGFLLLLVKSDTFLAALVTSLQTPFRVLAVFCQMAVTSIAGRHNQGSLEIVFITFFDISFLCFSIPFRSPPTDPLSFTNERKKRSRRRGCTLCRWAPLYVAELKIEIPLNVFPIFCNNPLGRI